MLLKWPVVRVNYCWRWSCTSCHWMTRKRSSTKILSAVNCDRWRQIRTTLRRQLLVETLWNGRWPRMTIPCRRRMTMTMLDGPTCNVTTRNSVRVNRGKISSFRFSSPRHTVQKLAQKSGIRQWRWFRLRSLQIRSRVF